MIVYILIHSDSIVLTSHVVAQLFVFIIIMSDHSVIINTANTETTIILNIQFHYERSVVLIL